MRHHTTVEAAIVLTAISLSLLGITIEPAAGLDCLKCHQKNLGAHSQLGSGSSVCKICHDERIMAPHTLNGTIVSDLTVSKLCSACHREKYAEWTYDTHGRHGLNYTATDATALSCTTCHDPHIPDLPEISPLPPPTPPERVTSLVLWIPPVLGSFAGAAFVVIFFTRSSRRRVGEFAE